MTEPETPLHQFERKKAAMHAAMERLKLPANEARWLLNHVRPDSIDELLELLAQWEREDQA